MAAQALQKQDMDAAHEILGYIVKHHSHNPKGRALFEKIENDWFTKHNITFKQRINRKNHGTEKTTGSAKKAAKARGGN